MVEIKMLPLPEGFLKAKYNNVILKDFFKLFMSYCDEAKKHYNENKRIIIFTTKKIFNQMSITDKQQFDFYIFDTFDDKDFYQLEYIPFVSTEHPKNLGAIPKDFLAEMIYEITMFDDPELCILLGIENISGENIVYICNKLIRLILSNLSITTTYYNLFPAYISKIFEKYNHNSHTPTYIFNIGRVYELDHKLNIN